MEAVMFYGSVQDQGFNQYKSHAFNNNSFINSRSYNKFSPYNKFQNMGLLQAQAQGPYFSHSYPPPYSTQQQQPPLLPLPPANRRIINNNNTTTTNRNKSKSPTKNHKNSNSPKKSNGPLKQDINQLQKGHINRVLPSFSTGKISASGAVNIKDDGRRIRGIISTSVKDEVDEVYSGSVVLSISPPPSSVPLPTFFLRPKVSCNVEAATGVDAGATDNLRRLLRLSA